MTTTQHLSCRICFPVSSTKVSNYVQLLFKRLIVLGGSFNNNVPCKCPRITCRKLVSAIVLSKNAYLRAGFFRRRKISLNEWVNEWMNHMVRDYFHIFPGIHLKFQCVISEPSYFGRNTPVEIHQKRALQGFNTRFEVRWFIDGSQSSEVVGTSQISHHVAYVADFSGIVHLLCWITIVILMLFIFRIIATEWIIHSFIHSFIHSLICRYKLYGISFVLEILWALSIIYHDISPCLVPSF